MSDKCDNCKHIVISGYCGRAKEYTDEVELCSYFEPRAKNAYEDYLNDVINANRSQIAECIKTIQIKMCVFDTYFRGTYG